ncbi:MAG: flagellar motor protein MotB [Burkholderiaceae bacterium]|nr:flagellar motor protein MotB [Burkholderiaceae bacterium]MEB2350369.1 flagellar motor protein MotB [Burkholderiaceae bacterium]
MAAPDRKVQPIVVRRIRKVNRAGHHGGAWKIAYADFVTAMMAFFLLMWLLGSTTSGDLQGISDYFRTPLKVALMGGSGSGDSSSVIRGGGTDLTRTVGHERRGDVAAPQKKVNLQALRAELRRAEAQRLGRLKAQVEEMINLNPALAGLRSQIRIDLTSDGLRIQIVDAQNRPMFDRGSAAVKDYMRELLREIGELLNSVDNRVSLSGHTDAAPYGSGDRGYSNWELSADRANASRRELVAGGMSESKVLRVVGLGPSLMFDAANPLNAMNRRIMIVVLNRDAEARILEGTEVDASDSAQLDTALSDAGSDAGMKARIDAPATQAE